MRLLCVRWLTHKRARVLPTAITMLLTCAVALAQNNDQTQSDFSQYKITYWTTDDGLPGNTLVHLYQDRNGYLWIGSYDGLCRFDGNAFISYNRLNTSDLVSYHVKVVTGDRDGNLWLGTGNGLLLYTKGKFINLAGQKHNFFIESMGLDEANQKIWIGTRSSGFYCYDIKTKQYNKIESEFDKLFIYTLELDSNGDIWAGGGTNKLGYFKNNAWTYYTVDDRPGLEIMSVYPDKNGTVLIGTNSGMFTKDGDKIIPSAKFEDISINKIKKDNDGNVWVLTITEGLFKQHPNNQWEQFTYRDGLSNNDLRDILFDSEGSIWLATYRGGLNQLRKTKFMTLSVVSEAAGAETMRTIRELSKNKFIAGSLSGKLYTIEQNQIKPLVVKTPLARVYDLLVDQDNNVLVATLKGLLLVTPNGRQRLFTEPNDLPTRQLRVVFQDRKKQYWIGTRNLGLLKMTMGKSPSEIKFEQYKTEELTSPFIMSIAEDRDGNLLVGTNTGGLNVISQKGVQVYGMAQGLNSNIIFSAYGDAEGVLWIATSDGISRIENGACSNFTRSDGLPQETVFDIVEDDRGYFWMPSAKGIVRVEKKQLNDYKAGKIKRIDWKLFGKQDDLKSSECTATSHVFKGSNGTLWFPMLDGVVAVNPHSIEKNNILPKIYIDDIIVDENKMNIEQPVVIPPGHQRVTINYTALSLLYPKTTRYKYQLQDFDAQWIDAGNDRQAAYTNLPDGNYTFKVISCNNDGVWNTAAATIPLTVSPYFFETSWFFALMVIGFGLATYGYTRWRTFEVSRKNLLLEQEVAKRTTELIEKSEKLAEENREKASILGIVSHDLRSPFNKIKGLINLMRITEKLTPEDRDEYFNHMENSIDQGNHLISDLLEVESLEVKKSDAQYSEVELTNFIQSWKQTTEGLLKQKEQALIIQNEVEDLILNTDPNLLTRVLDNLVSNASKFSERKKPIYITVTDVSNNVNFIVRDEGPGISESDQKKLFRKFQKLTARPTAGEGSTGLGLSITKALVKKLKGTIEVESTLGEGTTFTVKLPFGNK